MGICEYCGQRRAVNRDHVVPKSLQKRYYLPAYLSGTVGSCFECNIRKGTRALVPSSWAEHISALKEYIPQRHWREWDGDPKSPAFNGVHK